jgi:hypothetical protein
MWRVAELGTVASSWTGAKALRWPGVWAVPRSPWKQSKVARMASGPQLGQAKHRPGGPVSR